MQKKIVITGGPHSGKTTLFEALKPRHPTAFFIPEPATIVIADQLELQAKHRAHAPIGPWSNSEAFEWLVVDTCEKLESEIPPSADLIFQDRSLLDAAAYASLNGLVDFSDKISHRILAAKYSFALMCEPVGDYTTTRYRTESEERATLIYSVIKHTYTSYDIPIYTIPAVSIEDRIAVVSSVLNSATEDS